MCSIHQPSLSAVKEAEVKSMVNTILAAVTTVMIMSPGTVTAQTPYDLNREDSLYSDVKANMIGDVLTVVISESNSATNNTRTQTKKQDKATAKGSATSGALEGLFPGIGGSLDVTNQFSGQGGTLRNATFSSRMSVKVVDIMPDGNLIVEGTKSIEINQELEVITLSGTVKPEDVNSSNTIFSYQIANAKLTYKGKGANEQAHRPGLLMRFFNWIL